MFNYVICVYDGSVVWAQGKMKRAAGQSGPQGKMAKRGLGRNVAGRRAKIFGVFVWGFLVFKC